jgi:hypothetical protein
MRILIGALGAGMCAVWVASAPAQKVEQTGVDAIVIPTAPPVGQRPQAFRDGHFGVRFEVPAGWSVTRKDGEVSTFHSDARTAPDKAQMRAVASLEFNPYPQSVLSGASFYYSVQKHIKPAACAMQAASEADPQPDSETVAGVAFNHGHDEHGQICTEARDEVYTAYRKGSCYRFDLAMNTFCAISSGAQDLTPQQLAAVEQRMTDILSTVVFSWSKNHAAPRASGEKAAR